MFTIDSHTHIIPINLPDYATKFGYGKFINLVHVNDGKAWMMQGGTKFRQINANCWDKELRIKEMNQHEIDLQVISTIPVLFNYWAKPEHCLETSQFLNDDIIKTINENSNKFLGLATVPMQDTEIAIKELERCMKIGFKGVQIGSNINNLNLNEPQFDEFFAACETLNASILIHPWQMMGEEHMSKYWLPWLVGMPAEISRAICSMIFGGIFEKYKKLKVCFAHGGGSFLPTISRIEHGWKTRPDLVAIDNAFNPKDYLGKFWVDSHVSDLKLLDYIIDLVGAEKVIQGSDYPFPLGESIPGELVRKSKISDKDKALVLGLSAKNWLSF